MLFNAVNFCIWGIPGYFFFAVIGLVVSVCTFIILLAGKKYSVQKYVHILAVSIVGLFLFARLFGCLSVIYRDIGLKKNIMFEDVKNSGIVFYGGLFGLLITYRCIIKLTSLDLHTIDVLAVCIPLFHAIARVGCFVGGCCYGIEGRKSFITIEYTVRIMDDIVTANRIPTQLIESIFNLLLFVYLLVLFYKYEWKNEKILNRYLLIYSIERFAIEFLRGDSIRGIVSGISFSQIISILIWLYLINDKMKSYKKLEKEEIKICP